MTRSLRFLPALALVAACSGGTDDANPDTTTDAGTTTTTDGGTTETVIALRIADTAVPVSTTVAPTFAPPPCPPGVTCKEGGETITYPDGDKFDQSAAVWDRSDRLTVAVAPDLPLVRVDAVLLEQALFNVLDNAARHTPPGTQVAVAAIHVGEVVILRVDDDGPGLSVARASRDGLGLGLSIVKGILRAHGGKATLGVGSSGHGTEVVLSIPVPREAPSLPPESTITTTASTRKETP